MFSILDDHPSITRQAEHGGTGPISFRRLWSARDFDSAIDFIDFTIVPPGSSIGEHFHHGNEEAYFVAAGSPLMTVSGTTRRLERGDIAVVRSGQSHSMLNDTTESVQILVFQVSLPESGNDERP